MMYQGLFGAITFYVSESDICTFRDFRQSREMQFVEHKTLDGLGRLQHTGRSLDPVSLNVIIVPMNQTFTVELRLRALDALSRLGQELPLVIGLKYHGLYVLKSYDITRKQIHFGVTLSAEVSLSLLEYN